MRSVAYSVIDVTTDYLIKQPLSSLALMPLLDTLIPFSLFTHLYSYLQLQHLTINCDVVREINLDFAAIPALYPLPRPVQLFLLGLLNFDGRDSVATGPLCLCY